MSTMIGGKSRLREAVLERIGPRDQLPGPPGWPVLGNIPELSRGLLGFVRQCQARYGDFFRLWTGRAPLYVILSPSDVERMLISERDKFVKGKGYDNFRLLVGDGMVTSEGDLWRRQRRIAQPSFNRGAVAALAEPMARATARTLDRWQARLRPGADFDIYAELLGLTMWIIGDTLFSLDLDSTIDSSAEAFTVALEELSERGNRLVQPPIWLPTPSNRRLRRALALLDEVVFGIIERRRRDASPRGDLLGAFLAARDEEGRELPTKLLRDEVITFFLAGHETTALSLSWTMHALMDQPEVMQRLTAEVDAVLGDRQPTAEDIAALPYTRMVLQEAMRLYPPVWSGGRELIAPFEIAGHTIPPGQTLIVPYLMQRDARYFPDPERFDPERFRPGADRSRERGAYIPFSAGPRMCLGNHFSLFEGAIILAMIVQRFRFTRTPGRAPVPEYQITMRPGGGVWLRLLEARVPPR
ncbi:MAG: cytochrome P450 [Nannocystis sp.]|nr:cytochrome P450 [Nannocystis sp.]